MAKNREQDLFESLRNNGVRKKVAKKASESTAMAKNGKPAKAVTRTVASLKQAAADLESRVHGSSRSEAAKKAARTRKRNAAKRSEAAKKAARTRAAARR
ncbi:MAG: hypothetical protein ACRDPA_13185 [Solirubrobacteraceae bacterium]